MIIYTKTQVETIYERNERRINTFGDVCWFLDQLKVFGNKKAKHPEHDTQSRPMLSTHDVGEPQF